MSFFSWQHAVRASKLESTTKLVCYTIWSHMASDGSGCFPSYATIAEEAGLGRSTVIAHVQKAADAGFLIVDARQRDNGSTTSNLYRPAMPGGVPQLDRGGPLAGLGVVPQLDPHNKPSEQISEVITSLFPQPEKTKAKKNENRGQRLETYLEQQDGAWPIIGDGCPLEWASWASNEFQTTGGQWLSVFLTFRDYWRSQPGAKGVKSDWPATWRNWCRREHERTSRSYSGPAVRSASQRNAVGALFEAAGWDEAARKRG